MKHFSQKNQHGFGAVGFFIAMVIILALAFAGWVMWQKNDETLGPPPDKKLQTIIDSASCSNPDKNVCKFFASWKAQTYYTLTSSNEVAAQKTTATYKTEGSDKYAIKVEGSAPYEIISIKNTVYTKAGNIWYKQTLPNEKIEEYKNNVFINIEDPGKDNATYALVGKEKCGTLTCLKYQVTNNSSPKTVELLWLDTVAYKPRRTTITSPGAIYNGSFSYDKVSISAPASSQALGPNQYIVPGQSQPTTLPATGDSAQTLEEYLEQYPEERNRL